MAKTIIQTIGPLYGDVVNGTVFGRPNGSVYVPSENKITLSLKSLYVKADTAIRLCNSAGANVAGVSFTAESQDIASYVVVEISDSSAFTTVSSNTVPAGIFNLVNGNYIAPKSEDLPITNEGTYYMRAVLMASSGVPVATSDTITVTGWASE